MMDRVYTMRTNINIENYEHICSSVFSFTMFPRFFIVIVWPLRFQSCAERAFAAAIGLAAWAAGCETMSLETLYRASCSSGWFESMQQAAPDLDEVAMDDEDEDEVDARTQTLDVYSIDFWWFSIFDSRKTTTSNHSMRIIYHHASIQLNTIQLLENMETQSIVILCSPIYSLFQSLITLVLLLEHV